MSIFAKALGWSIENNSFITNENKKISYNKFVNDMNMIFLLVDYIEKINNFKYSVIIEFGITKIINETEIIAHQSSENKKESILLCCLIFLDKYFNNELK